MNEDFYKDSEKVNNEVKDEEKKDIFLGTCYNCLYKSI